MFQTSECMRLPVPDELQPSSAEQWHTVQQTLPDCWFHIHYFDHSEELEGTIFTSELDSLNQVVARNDISLLGISLASPPRLNGEGCWLLSPLDQVHVHSIEQDDQEILLGYEYKLANGQVLVELWAEHLKSDASKLKLVFSSPISRSEHSTCQPHKELTTA